MDLKALVLEAWEILQLKEATIHRVAHDRSKLQGAVLCILIGALATSLGFFFFPVSVGFAVYRPDLGWVVGSALGAAVTQALVLAVTGFVAERLFHSKLSTQGYFQVLGMASLVNLLGLVPGLGIVASVWMLVVMGKVLHSEGKMEPGAIAVLIVLLMVFFGALSYAQVWGF